MADLLSAQERTTLLHTWNATAIENQSPCIHELIAAQAMRTPEATALIYHDRQLSYQELDEQSNQVAHVLQRHGVAPLVRVGLCLERP